jgi:thiol-disulfide isomerase/thioredoxin
VTVRALVAAALLMGGCATSGLGGARWPHYRSALQLEAVAPGRGGVLNARALEGRVVLVTFMSTWCALCLMDLPYYRALHAQYRDRGFSVVAVGMDLEGELVLRPFAEQYELEFPLVLADERIRRGETPFGPIRELPTTFLLAEDGTVLAAFTGLAPQRELSALVERAVRDGAGW